MVGETGVLVASVLLLSPQDVSQGFCDAPAQSLGQSWLPGH